MLCVEEPHPGIVGTGSRYIPSQVWEAWDWNNRELCGSGFTGTSRSGDRRGIMARDAADPESCVPAGANDKLTYHLPIQ